MNRCCRPEAPAPALVSTAGSGSGDRDAATHRNPVKNFLYVDGPSSVVDIKLLDYRVKRRPHLLQNAPRLLFVFEDLDHAAVAVAFQA